MITVSIDGACRRNGKPDCVAAGGVLIVDDTSGTEFTKFLTNYEFGSTSQRGEMLGLLTALDYIYTAEKQTRLIMDSEFLFNALSKNWISSWEQKGWKTASGDPVKNTDMWLQINWSLKKLDEKGIELVPYHIKGHVIPFGKVTASTLIDSDSSGAALLKAVRAKVDSELWKPNRADVCALADELSMKNNGFLLGPSVLRDFVVYNLMADAVATKCVEAADALYSS